MKHRTQIFFLSSVFAVLVIIALSLGVYVFRNDGSRVTIVKSDRSETGQNNAEKIEKKPTTMDTNKDKTSDNLTQQTLASIVDALKAKKDDPDLSDEELKNYIEGKIKEVDVFSYSFKKQDIKTSFGETDKKELENYLTEIYNIIPEQTVFSGNLDINSFEEGLGNELDSLIDSDKQAFVKLIEKEVPREAALIHETYLKLLDSEISLLAAIKNEEEDPLKVNRIIAELEKEWRILRQVLNSELRGLVGEYGIELDI